MLNLSKQTSGNMKSYLMLLSLIIIVLLIGCTQDRNQTRKTTGTAFPFYEMGINIHSENDIRAYYNNNIDEIIEANIELLVNPPLRDNYYSWGPKLMNMFKKRILTEHLSVKYRSYLRSDPIWIFDSYELKYYVVEVPLVSKEEEWVYEDGEVRVYFEQCKTAMRVGQDCPEYERVYRLPSILKHIITKSGIIYYGGAQYYH
jgi:hypothetical protein